MKMLKTLIAVCFLTSLTSYSADLSEADKKWSQAVEKMIVEGSATISTPLESRAKIVKELVAKLGRESKSEKTDKGFKIVVDAPKAKNIELAKASGK